MIILRNAFRLPEERIRINTRYFLHWPERDAAVVEGGQDLVNIPCIPGNWGNLGC